MIAGKYKLTIEQDGDLFLLLYLEDDAGDAIDLTDCDAEAYVVRTPGASTKLVAFSSEGPEDGDITLGGALGTRQPDLAQEDVDALPPGAWYWYLYIEGLAALGSGRRRLLEGPCIVSQAAGAEEEEEPAP